MITVEQARQNETNNKGKFSLVAANVATAFSIDAEKLESMQMPEFNTLKAKMERRENHHQPSVENGYTLTAVATDSDELKRVAFKVPTVAEGRKFHAMLETWESAETEQLKEATDRQLSDFVVLSCTDIAQHEIRLLNVYDYQDILEFCMNFFSESH